MLKKCHKPTLENISKYKEYNNIYKKLCRIAKNKYTSDTYMMHKNDCKKYGNF